jgi:sterol desaturase/sphingolipid hydroxylase (fatty acid hydroxylase superfamily)
MTVRECWLALTIIAILVAAHLWVFMGWHLEPPTPWLAAVSPYAIVIMIKIQMVLPLLCILTLLQIAIPGVRRPAKYLSYEFWLDVAYNFQSAVMYLTVLGGVIVACALLLTDLTPLLFPRLAELPGPVQVFLAVWLYDFVVYWRHRTFHWARWLWPFHAVHHVGKQVDMFTTYRLHIVELMIGGILNRWIGGIIGLSDAALSQGFALYIYYNYFIHSNIAGRFPGLLKYVLVSPFMHRWHHAIEPSARDRNFGVVFAWHDWLFGTALHPDHEPTGYGIEQDTQIRMSESWLSQQLYPFRRFSAVVLRSIGSRHG